MEKDPTLDIEDVRKNASYFLVEEITSQPDEEEGKY